MNEYQFLIGVNDGHLNNNNLNVPILTPSNKINIYFMEDYIIEPFIDRHGLPNIINLEIKICLLNLTKLNNLLINNSLENLSISADSSADLTSSNLASDLALSDLASSLNTSEIEKQSKCPFTIILNDDGLESPILINSIIYDSDNINTIKLYVHNLSQNIYTLRKNTSMIQLVNYLGQSTMKIISIDDPIFI